MAKTRKQQQIEVARQSGQTLIPPDQPLMTPETAAQVTLTTPGNVKSQILKLYRKAASGKISWAIALAACRILDSSLKAMVVEHEMGLHAASETEDRPAFTGLVLVGPTEGEGDDATNRDTDGVHGAADAEGAKAGD